MKQIIIKLIETLDKNSQSSDEIYFELLAKINFQIDIDFLEFIKKHNGAEGYIGGDNFLLFWTIEQLIALNPYYEEVEECKKLFFFGTDGSNLGYAFEKETGKIISIDFLDISTVNPDFISDSFELFLEKISM
jgi:hypothetical protein